MKNIARMKPRVGLIYLIVFSFSYVFNVGCCTVWIFFYLYMMSRYLALLCLCKWQQKPDTKVKFECLANSI